jgi:hypothetical protein
MNTFVKQVFQIAAFSVLLGILILASYTTCNSNIKWFVAKLFTCQTNIAQESFVLMYKKINVPWD